MKIFVVLFVLMSITVIVAEEVTFFWDINHQGASINKRVSHKCKNLREFADKISSVNTQGHCIYVYRRYNCKGRHASIAPGTSCHSDFKDCDMNDHVRSVKLC